MPMYYFHLRDQDQITDVDGTELADVDAAREHAETVARELKFKSDSFMDQPWSNWSMLINDSDDVEVLSFGMSDVGNGGAK